MKQVTHALCAECYAGAVDVGVATPEPTRLARQLRIEEVCCGLRDGHCVGLYLNISGGFVHCDHERSFIEERR